MLKANESIFPSLSFFITKYKVSKVISSNISSSSITAPALPSGLLLSYHLLSLSISFPVDGKHAIKVTSLIKIILNKKNNRNKEESLLWHPRNSPHILEIISSLPPEQFMDIYMSQNFRYFHNCTKDGLSSLVLMRGFRLSL